MQACGDLCCGKSRYTGLCIDLQTRQSTMPEVTFYEQYEWNSHRAAMKFWALVDGETRICWIDAASLNALGEGRDDTPQALFMQHQQAIFSLAENLIHAQRYDDEGAIAIGPTAIDPP